MSARTLPPELLEGDQNGAALVEMTLVIPFLLTIGLGLFEFGNIYYKYHLMENAVRDGARFASSLVGNVCTDTTLQNQVKAIVQRTGAANQVWTTGYTITVGCTSYNNKANGYNYRGGDTISSVKVTATVPYQSLGFLGFFRLAPPTLTVSQEERVIGGR